MSLTTNKLRIFLLSHVILLTFCSTTQALLDRTARLAVAAALSAFKVSWSEAAIKTPGCSTGKDSRLLSVWASDGSESFTVQSPSEKYDRRHSNEGSLKREIRRCTSTDPPKSSSPSLFYYFIFWASKIQLITGLSGWLTFD